MLINSGFEFIVEHPLAAGLINKSHGWLDRQRDRQRVVRGALDREIAQFPKCPAGSDLAPVIQTGHTADIVGRSKRAEFDLDELGRGKFELVLCLGGGVVTVALAEPADGVDRDFLLALQSDAGTGGESEDVFGFDLFPGSGVLRARASGAAKYDHQQQCR